MRKTYKSKEVHVCKECAGDGSIVNHGEHLGHGRYSESTTEQCPLCKGSGLVTIEKLTTVTITPKQPIV